MVVTVAQQTMLDGCLMGLTMPGTLYETASKERATVAVKDEVRENFFDFPDAVSN